MTDKILVLTTASSKDEARKIGRVLVETAAGGLRKHRPAGRFNLPLGRGD